jgi:hypothetical protein
MHILCKVELENVYIKYKHIYGRDRYSKKTGQHGQAPR